MELREMTREQLITKVYEYLRKREEEGNKISQNAFAKLLGYGESTLSLWLNGKYKESAKVDKSVIDFFERNEERSKVKTVHDVQFALTENAKNIWNMLEYCMVMKTNVCIYGDAGCGKTMTMEEWAKGKPNVICITVSPYICGAKAILEELAGELKLKTTGTMRKLGKSVMDRLKGSDITIIFDEAQFFPHETIEGLRSIQDVCKIGMAYIGNAITYNKITGNKKAEFQQIFQRFSYPLNILTDHFILEDIYSLLGDMEGDAAEYLLKIAKSEYGLRTVPMVYVNALNNGDITKKGLVAIARGMRIHI